MGRRVLITGLASFWGGRVAQALEADPDVEVLIGVDTSAPTVELERTEYVRTDENHSILSRIVHAARIDTIIHLFLVVDPGHLRPRAIHEINVIGTMNLFAAASAPGSTVRDVVVKSSGYVYGASPTDPVWFTEDTPRSRPPQGAIERSLEAVEGYVRDFAVDNPHVDVTLLRFANVLGADIDTPLSRMLELPLVPSIFGFDPGIQLVHADDVVRSILFVLDEHLPGIFNVAGPGLVPWSEIAHVCGKRTVPLPVVGTSLAAWPLRKAGVALPEELLDLLRYGRGLDTGRLERAGFRYRHTTAGAAEAFVEAMRLRKVAAGDDGPYRYERDVEQFFQHSPAVVRELPGEG
jgi:UDP-glucose 4-epimerase